MATPVDPDSQFALTMGTIAALRNLVADGMDSSLGIFNALAPWLDGLQMTRLIHHIRKKAGRQRPRIRSDL